MIFLFFYFFALITFSNLRRARARRIFVTHPSLISSRTAPSNACTSTLEFNTNTTNKSVLASEDPSHTYLLTTQSTDLEVLSPTYDYIYKFRSAPAFALILG